MLFRHRLRSLLQRLLLVIVVLSLQPLLVVFAAPVSLDPLFDGDGKVMTAFGSGTDYGFSLVIQSDGKLVLAGQASVSGNDDFALVRYNTDGTLDSTFDGDGKVTTAIGSGSDIARVMVMQSDGRLVLAGLSSNGSDSDFALARYNADGSLDASFNGTGKLTTVIGSGNEQVNAIAIQSDNKLVVAGEAIVSGNYDFALARYNADGTLDATFDGDGKVTTAIGSSNDYIFAMAIQNDGKIVVAGQSVIGGSSDFALARYNADGTLDTSFNGTGKLTTAIGPSDDRPNAMTIQNDGKLVVAGLASNGSNNDFALARYNADGTLDTSFNGTGKLTTAIGPGRDGINAVIMMPDSKILVAGYAFTTSDDFALARYNADGTLDTSFDDDGKLTTDFNGGTDFAHTTVLQGDGKIVIGGGVTNSGTFDFGLARYFTDTSISPRVYLPLVIR